MGIAHFRTPTRSTAKCILLFVSSIAVLAQTPVTSAKPKPPTPPQRDLCHPADMPTDPFRPIVTQTGAKSGWRPLPVTNTDNKSQRDYLVLVYDAENHRTAFYDYDVTNDSYSLVPNNGAFLPVIYTKEKILVRVCNLHPTDTVSISGNSFTLPEQGADIRGTSATTVPALAPTLDTLGSASAAGSPFSPAGVNFGSSAPLTSIPISGFTFGSANKDSGGYSDAVINVSPEALALETISLIRDAQDAIHTIKELNNGDTNSSSLQGSVEGSIASLQKQANYLLIGLENDKEAKSDPAAKLGWFNQRLAETQQLVSQLNGLATGVSQAGLGPRAVAIRQNFESILGVLRQVKQVMDDDEKIDNSQWVPATPTDTSASATRVATGGVTTTTTTTATASVTTKTTTSTDKASPTDKSAKGGKTPTQNCHEIYNLLISGAFTSNESIPADSFTCRAYERYIMRTFLDRFNGKMNEILAQIATEEVPDIAPRAVELFEQDSDSLLNALIMQPPARKKIADGKKKADDAAEKVRLNQEAAMAYQRENDSEKAILYVLIEETNGRRKTAADAASNATLAKSSTEKTKLEKEAAEAQKAAESANLKFEAAENAGQLVADAVSHQVADMTKTAAMAIGEAGLATDPIESVKWRNLSTQSAKAGEDGEAAKTKWDAARANTNASKRVASIDDGAIAARDTELEWETTKAVEKDLLENRAARASAEADVAETAAVKQALDDLTQQANGARQNANKAVVEAQLATKPDDKIKLEKVATNAAENAKLKREAAEHAVLTEWKWQAVKADEKADRDLKDAQGSLKDAYAQQAHASHLKAKSAELTGPYREAKLKALDDEAQIADIEAKLKPAKESAQAATQAANELEQARQKAEEDRTQNAANFQQDKIDVVKSANFYDEIGKQSAPGEFSTNSDQAAQVREDAAATDKLASDAAGTSSLPQNQSVPPTEAPGEKVTQEGHSPTQNIVAPEKSQSSAPHEGKGDGKPTDNAGLAVTQDAEKKRQERASLERSLATATENLKDAQSKEDCAFEEVRFYKYQADQAEGEAAKRFNDASSKFNTAAGAAAEADRATIAASVALSSKDKELSEKAVSIAIQWREASEDIGTFQAYLANRHPKPNQGGVSVEPEYGEELAQDNVLSAYYEILKMRSDLTTLDHQVSEIFSKLNEDYRTFRVEQTDALPPFTGNAIERVSINIQRNYTPFTITGGATVGVASTAATTSASGASSGGAAAGASSGKGGVGGGQGGGGASGGAGNGGGAAASQSGGATAASLSSGAPTGSNDVTVLMEVHHRATFNLIGGVMLIGVPTKTYATVIQAPTYATTSASTSTNPIYQGTASCNGSQPSSIGSTVTSIPTTNTTPFYCIQATQTASIQLAGMAGVEWFIKPRDYFPNRRGVMPRKANFVPSLLVASSVTSLGSAFIGGNIEPVNGFNFFVGSASAHQQTFSTAALQTAYLPGPSNAVPTLTPVTNVKWGLSFGVGFDLSVFTQLFTKTAGPQLP